MFTKKQSVGEQKGAEEWSSTSSTSTSSRISPHPQPLTQRKGRPAAVSASPSSSSVPVSPPPPFLPSTVSPARVAQLNFVRLLDRVERSVEEERGHSRAEEKEASQSVRQRTALPKSVQSLKAQLDALIGSLDRRELSGFVHRLSRLWTEVNADAPVASAPLRLRTLPLPTPPTPFITRPSLPLLSSSSASSALFPSSHPSSASSPPPTASAHPLADASHFTSSQLRPAPVNSAQLRAELFASSTSSSSSSSASSSVRAEAEAEAQLTALAQLAPALKEQVKAIAAHLKVDEAVVADTSQMMDGNLERVKRENVRLRGWARASCGETCWMTAVIALILTAFALMVLLMKIIPKPR